MENKLNETLIDLSVDIYQKCPTLPNHPPMVLSDYQTHKTIREAEGVKFSCASMYMSMGEHTGTHVDAFNHFDPDPNAQSIDQMPLENFYTDGICLDLSHKPLKSNISIEDLENALSKDNLEINKKILITDGPIELSEEAAVFGVYDPADYDFNLNMWSNTKAEDVRASIKRLKKIKLSKTSNDILENILLKTMYDLPSQENIKEVIVDAASVKGQSQPIIVHSESDDKSKPSKTSAA